MSLSSLFEKTQTAGTGGGLDASTRLLSARTGAINATQNMLPRSGYAAPLVAATLGSQVGEQEQQSAEEKKMTDFLGTFQKLSKVSKLMAVKFFNENGPEVGIDTPIDGVDAQPDVTTVHFDNGKVVGIAMDGIYMPGPDGKWTQPTPDFLNSLRSDAMKKKATGSAGGTEKKTAVLAQYRGLLNTIASTNDKITNNPGAQRESLKRQVSDAEAAKQVMIKQYPWLATEVPDVGAPAPAVTNTAVPQKSALESILEVIKKKNSVPGPMPADEGIVTQ